MLQQRGPIVIVVSALSAVTDLLVDLVAAAERGESAGVKAGVDQFRRRHHAVARALLKRGEVAPVLPAIDQQSDELEALVRALSVLREASQRVRDHVISRGERLSARLVTAALQSRGAKALLVDAIDAIITDGPYGDAAPNLAATRTAVRESVLPPLSRGLSVVVPGFLGRAPDGGTATLGRSGSDLTATTLARAIDAERVTLWKDVPGLLTDMELHDVAGLVAPRALFVESGENDRIFPIAGFRTAAERARRIYAAFGVPEQMGAEAHPGVHEFHGVGAFAFLERVL